ncbi:hypothetical protein [Lactococcus hircilactis]|uniref:hypothetical protein n=1 Tax=Lactococcus hircilactis TaxID=1494462 RepID=UPI003FA32DAF
MENEDKALVSSVAFIEADSSSEKEEKITQNILTYFKENEHYIDWRKENILNHFTNQILNETDYFDAVTIQTLPIDKEIQHFLNAVLDENDTSRQAMEQLTDQVSQTQSNYLKLQNELKATQEKLTNAIELNKALVKEKWYQKLFRSFSDYKYKYEIENTPPKK